MAEGGAGTTQRHPATDLVWEWLEHGEGREKPEAIRRAARERVEELDRLFIEWDAEIASRPVDE